MNLISKILCLQIDQALVNFIYENIHIYIYISYAYFFMFIYNYKPMRINRYESDQQDTMSSNRPSASQACEFDSSIQV
jgi:hypothetical protein